LRAHDNVEDGNWHGHAGANQRHQHSAQRMGDFGGYDEDKEQMNGVLGAILSR